MFTRLEILKKTFGFSPRVIFDIGAHMGTWTEQCKRIYPDATYYQFEANTDHAHLLKDNPTIDILGNKNNETVTYYKSKSALSTGNSIFKENSAYFDDDVCEKEERIMKRLDTVVSEKSYPFPDFIKLDTQGSELLILEGAPACMRSADIILLEASITVFNNGSPLLHDVLDFMNKQGFVVFDFADLHYVGNILNQVDLLFCKKDSKYLLKDFHWATPSKKV